MKHADAVALVGSLRHQLVHQVQRLHGGIVLLLDIGRAEFARASRVRRQPRKAASAVATAVKHQPERTHQDHRAAPLPALHPCPPIIGSRSWPCHRRKEGSIWGSRPAVDAPPGRSGCQPVNHRIKSPLPGQDSCQLPARPAWRGCRAGSECFVPVARKKHTAPRRNHFAGPRNSMETVC